MNLFLDRQPIFSPDINACEPDLLALVSGARFLVIGGAGSIGQAVVKEIFVRSPAALHVVDINENNLVELVRDLRSSSGYMKATLEPSVLIQIRICSMHFLAWRDP